MRKSIIFPILILVLFLAPPFSGINKVSARCSSYTTDKNGNTVCGSQSANGGTTVDTNTGATYQSVPTDTTNFCLDKSGSIGSFVSQSVSGVAILTAADLAAGLLNHFTGLGQPIQDTTDLLIRHYIRAILWGIIASIAVPLIGFILQVILTLNNSILSVPVIKDIFVALIGFINVGFVMVLVVMAFATMFKNKKWGVGNLPKLIIAAVLINFSWFAAEAVLNIGNNIGTIMEYATTGQKYESGISAPTPSAVGAALTLADKYNVAKITCSIGNYISDSSQNSGVVTGLITSVAKPLMSVTIGSIITLLWAASLLAITIFFAARFVFVALLVSIMPISWLGYIFPDAKIPDLATLRGWWGKYLCWVFTGPLMLFVLYMSRSVSQWLAGSGSTNSPTATSVFGSGSILLGDSGIVFQLAAILAINVGGLYAIIKWGCGMSDLMIKGVGGGFGWMAQKVNNGLGTVSAINRLRAERESRAAQKSWQRSRDTDLSEADREKAERDAKSHDAVAGRRMAISRITSGVALPGSFRSVFEKTGIKMAEEKPFNAEEQIKKLRESYAQRSLDEIVRMANNPPADWGPTGPDPVRAAAILSELADKGGLDNVDKSRIKILLRRAASVGGEKDALGVRPELARDLNNHIGFVMGVVGKIKNNEAEKISDITFSVPKDGFTGELAAEEEVVLGLSTAKINRIITEGSDDQRIGIINILRELRPNGSRYGALTIEGDDKLSDELKRKSNEIADYINKAAERNAAFAALLTISGGPLPAPQSPDQSAPRPPILGPNGQPLN